MRKGKLRLVVHDPCEAKISQLDIAVGIEEDVARLQVAMENLLRQIALARVLQVCLLFVDAIVNFRGFRSPVAVVQGTHCLREHFPNEVLANVFLRFAASSYELLQVAPIAVFHDDEDLRLLLIDQPVEVLHDVRVAELPQDVHLRHDLLLLLLAHDAIVQLLPYQNFPITNALYLLDLSKTTYLTIIKGLELIS